MTFLSTAPKNCFVRESICQNHETIRPKITIPGREARLIILRDQEIARLVGYASIAKPIITAYEGIKEKTLLF